MPDHDVEACLAIWHTDPETGRDLLLALAVDPEAAESDRHHAVRALLTMDPPTAAATAWLLATPNHRHTKDDLAVGLSLVAQNPYLDEEHRTRAENHGIEVSETDELFGYLSDLELLTE